MTTNIYSKKNIPMKTVVFASGSGTNFDKIYERQKKLEKENKKNFAKIGLVFSNNPSSKAIEKAENYGIKTTHLSSKKFFEVLNKSPDDSDYRENYDAAVISLIEEFTEPDLIVLAGYRRKLSSLLLNRYKNKIINLYPGDTTKNYLVKGKEAFIQALENGEKTIRCTCYIENNEEVRFGPAIAQSAEISLEGYYPDNTDEMSKKIRENGEWLLFPFVLHELIANGRVDIDDKNNVYIDKIKMNKTGMVL
ncbi:MAG: phosphoribosylglycinamide formyltransferase [Thermodesulfobacteriota bacterium]